MNIKSPLRLAVDGELVLKEATRRSFLRRSLTLGGLAMLRVLQGAFLSSFNGKFSLGALISLLVTVADISLLNIGAAFWGLLAGFVVSWMMEKGDFIAAAKG